MVFITPRGITYPVYNEIMTSSVPTKLVTVLLVAWDTDKYCCSCYLLTLITIELPVSEMMHFNVRVSKGDEMSDETKMN